nr:histidine phosphatase family protein [Deinococcus reticulitermitis]
MTSLPPSPTRLILVRHGQTAHNRERRVQGHIDAPLDETGHAQAARLARHLRAEGVRAPRLLASDLARARATAEALHAELGGTLNLHPELREIFMGRWEGELYDELAVRDAELHARFWSGDPDCLAPDGENARVVGERVHALLEREWPQPGETVIVVSHGIAISALLARLLGLDYQQEFQTRRFLHLNTAYSVLDVDPDTREIQASRLALSPHLELV